MSLKLRGREGRETTGEHWRFRIPDWLRARRLSRLVPLSLLALVMAVSLYFLAKNLFGFPHYENDEGTYMGSAWAMFTQGKLSYYTYTYDHPVLGWLVLGLWSNLVGGFEAFGNAINTGRVLMVAVGVISTGLIFEILRRSSGRVLVALPAALLFAVSPLGVSLHRQVWIDNMATMWLLGSILALVAARGRLGHAVLSAVLFGLAFWTKEVFVVFLPGMLYLAFVHSHPSHRRFALALWGVLSCALVSLFLLLATLKDELLPPGVLWSSPEPHVSLLETLGNQASRGNSDGLLNPGGQFWTFFSQWRYNDPVLILGGLAAALVGLLMWRRDRVFFGISLITLMFFLFLGRGGVVLYYYVIPLLALFSLTLGLLAANVVNVAVRFKVPGAALGAVLMVLALGIFVHGVQSNEESFNENGTASQNEAARWISDNLSEDSTIISDAFLWTDLRSSEFTGGKVFDRAHYYFPALSDDTIREGELENDWRNIDYIAVSPTTQADIERDFVPLLPEASRNADLVTTFRSDDWQVQIKRIRKLGRTPATADPVLVSSWNSYKSRFVAEGRVINLTARSQTTAGQQATTMQQAVYMNDRETFDEVWSWTLQNLQRSDGLLLADYDSGEAPTTSSAADTDAALSLLMASKRWNDSEYEAEALRVMDGIWRQETVPTALGRVVTAGDAPDGTATGAVRVDTGALSPHAYRIFAEADTSRPWEDLAESSYTVLSTAADTPGLGSEQGLYPNALSVDTFSGAVTADPSDGATTGDNGLSRRLALDYLWFKDARAKEALEVLGRPSREMSEQDLIFSGYNLDGSVSDDAQSVSTYASAVVTMLLSGDGAMSGEVYASDILGDFDSGGDISGRAYWGEDPDDLTAQSDAWFTTALVDGAVANYWDGEEVVEWGDIDMS